MAEGAISEKELRIALVCYGGVSLAIYMHGVTKELWKLVRASEARQRSRRSGTPALLPAGDSEAVWLEFLREIGRSTDLSVIIDIMAGASAGGLNAVLLANALTEGHSLEPLTEMWMENADVDHLLDPDARPSSALLSRLGRIYKEPVAWFAGRHSATLAAVDEAEVRAEIATKLAYFVRSRWFKPPFSGEGLTAMIDNGMTAMAALPAGPPLVPPTVPLSLFITATDFWGSKAELAIHSPPVVIEREHRRLFTFESPPIAIAAPPRLRVMLERGALSRPVRRPVGSRPALLMAARATASFPGAFPPATIVEIDERLRQTGRDWPDRAQFVARQLAGDRPPEEIALIDGSVLNNAPFGAAIAAVRTRYGHREIARRFVYIDPTPDSGNEEERLQGHKPGFLSTILRSLADIPREQPIRESLAEIANLSAHSRRLRHVIDALPASIDAAILRAVGARFFRLPVSPARLARARSRIHSTAARSAGFAFGAYAQLKLQLVLDEAASLIGGAARLGNAEQELLRTALQDAAGRRGAMLHDAESGETADDSPYVQLLRALDLGYRVRRLRFFISRLSAVMAGTLTPSERDSAEFLKAELHHAVAPFEVSRAGLSAAQAAELTPAVARLLAATDAEARAGIAGGLIDSLAAILDLSARDAEVDATLAAAARDIRVGPQLRRDMIRVWLGYPFYDIIILPLMHDEHLHGFDELLVDRIAPDDAVALMEGGSRACLKGWQLSAFAAFFSRAYRENDYLWGRLNAAERLVDIVASAAPEAAIDATHWKVRLFRAIVATERERLSRVAPLLADLQVRIDNFARGVANPRPAK